MRPVNEKIESCLKLQTDDNIVDHGTLVFFETARDEKDED